LKLPEEGEKIKRLVEIAKERNIEYRPSAEAYHAMMDYIDRKGVPNPLSLDTCKQLEVANMAIPPQYNPH
jgi:hypothetical protein